MELRFKSEKAYSSYYRLKCGKKKSQSHNSQGHVFKLPWEQKLKLKGKKLEKYPDMYKKITDTKNIFMTCALLLWTIFTKARKLTMSLKTLNIDVIKLP